MAQPKASPPGRRITSVPAKPPATSAQRSGETCSLSAVAASSVITSGVIMHDRGELGHRHVAQAQEGEQAAGEQQRAAQHMVLGVLRAQQRGAVQRQQHRGGRDGLEGVAEPHAHQHRHRRADELGGGVEGGEAGDRQHHQADAGQDAFGFEVARAPRGAGCTGAHWMRSLEQLPHRRELAGQPGQLAEVAVAFVGAVEVAAARGGQAELERPCRRTRRTRPACGCRSPPRRRGRRAP